MSLLNYAAPLLAGQAATITTEELGDGWQRVRLTWQLDQPVQQDELTITVPLDFSPDFWWLRV